MANYRQLTTGTLGASNSCPQCYTTLVLCYSASGPTDLCCGSSNTAIVYVPAGQTFNSGTSSDANTLYATSDFQSVAPDGWYSDNTNNCGTP